MSLLTMMDKTLDSRAASDPTLILAKPPMPHELPQKFSTIQYGSLLASVSHPMIFTAWCPPSEVASRLAFTYLFCRRILQNCKSGTPW